MIVYKDRTWCNQGDKCTCDWYRKLTKEEIQQAVLWWDKADGTDEPPFAMRNFCGNKE